jgi:hypothetical protein
VATVASIARDTSETRQDVALIAKTQQRLVQQSSENFRMLRGHNGDVGLVALVGTVVKNVVKDHLLLHGKDDEPGLKGTVQELVQAEGNRSKALWIVLGVILGTSASGIVSLALARAIPIP